MKRTIFRDEHQQFRRLVRAFIEREVVPQSREWEDAGCPPRDIFRRLGEIGVMGISIAEEWGGGGQVDFTYNVVLQEETARAGVTIGSLRTQLDVILPYFLRYADADQQERWLPGICRGEVLTAIALTEPDTGSDLAAVRTTAVLEGDRYILNGAKTYVTGGALADLVIVLCRTSSDESQRRHGLTLLVVEHGMPGVVKGGKLDKIGLRAQDTIELSFTNVEVPIGNRLGNAAEAFGYLGANLPQERIAIAVGAVAQSSAALDLTLAYVKSRRTFGKAIGEYQNTKFELAAIASEVEAGQAMLDKAITELIDNELSSADAAKVKLFCTELQGRVVDRCLQFFGGFGYMTDSPIARLYVDARVTRIYGGTSEIMKSIISKSLGL